MFCPGRMGDSAESKVTQQLMGAEDSCLEIDRTPSEKKNPLNRQG